MAVAPHATPFSADGGPVGVLLVHGFTGSPSSMTPWARHLAEAGLTVRVPRLPGHGTSWQQLNRTRWQDWYAEAEVAFTELRARCSQVIVAGLSMGGTIVLRLAEEYGRQVAGVIVVNPFLQLTDPRLLALPVLHRLVPSLAAIGNDIKKPGVDEHSYPRTPLTALHSNVAFGKLVRDHLPKVTQPLLMFRSTVDHVVDPKSGNLLLRRVSSRDMAEIRLTDSYHVATLDNDAPTIFAESLKFIERVTGA